MSPGMPPGVLVVLGVLAQGQGTGPPPSHSSCCGRLRPGQRRATGSGRSGQLPHMDAQRSGTLADAPGRNNCGREHHQ